jgi:hypothetical protein
MKGGSREGIRICRDSDIRRTVETDPVDVPWRLEGRGGTGVATYARLVARVRSADRCRSRDRQRWRRTPCERNTIVNVR